MIQNLKSNIKNKTWWISIISLLVILAQSKGIDLTKWIGSDWQTTLNTIFSLAVLLGISVDTTSTSNTVANSTENTIQADSTGTNTSTENSSDATDDKNAIQLSNSIVPKENTAD